MNKKPTYPGSLAKDRDLYLRQRNKLAALLRDVIGRIGDRGQENSIRDAEQYMRDIGMDDEEET